MLWHIAPQAVAWASQHMPGVARSQIRCWTCASWARKMALIACLNETVYDYISSHNRCSQSLLIAYHSLPNADGTYTWKILLALKHQNFRECYKVLISINRTGKICTTGGAPFIVQLSSGIRDHLSWETAFFILSRKGWFTPQQCFETTAMRNHLSQKDHNFLTQRLLQFAIWEHLSWETIPLWEKGWSFKTGYTRTSTCMVCENCWYMYM